MTVLDEAVEEAYPDAVELARKETDLSIDIFPQQCPYSIEQIQNEAFYPESNAITAQGD